MTDVHNTLDQLCPSDTVDDLREAFLRIRRSATETSDREPGLTAAVMADLLTVARILGEDAETIERANEIIEFCRSEALPAITGSQSDEVVQRLRQDAEERWRECLSLLSPEERVPFAAEDSWTDAATSGWGELPHTPETDWNTCDERQPETIAVDLEGILASLAEQSVQPEQPVAMESEDDLTSPIDDQTDDAISEASVNVETIDDPELEAAFADDAQQCLAEMETSVFSLEADQSSDEPLRNFCRQLHTLKGASGTVGLTKLAKYLHNLESYIETTSGSDVDVDRLLQGVDTVRAQLGALGDANVSPEQASLPSVGAAGNDTELFVRVEASRLERLMDLLAELVMLRNRRDTYVDSLRSIHGELNHCASRTRTLSSTVELSTGTAALPEDSADAGISRNNPQSRLLSRSLDEVSKDTAELSRTLKDVCDPLSADNSAVSHLIGRFRQELMELRRLPVSGLFQRLQRAIRDAAKTEGKQVEIHFEGQGARAERAVQERLFEPLLHLVRNAVSHGIQSANERVQHGKPAVGRITLTAYSDAASLSIEVQDDGGGLNDEALETRGRALGLLPAGEAVSQKQLWKLIFHPGFSTKASVTEIAGRGVGMDVVDSWVRRLRGQIDVESVAGQGTTFRLQIPLRSAVEHAMVVRAGGQLFALPMHAVSRTSDRNLPTSETSCATTNADAIPLGRLLGCGERKTSRGCHISLRDTGTTPNRRSSDVVTIAVDAIVGVEEVVVRSLPPLLQRNELFAGVTLSGRAETVLLLDARRLIDLTEGDLRNGVKKSDSVFKNGVTDHSNDEPQRDWILVVDDSVVVRKCLSKKLRAEGHSVREADNGRNALDLLKAGGFKAVVTDIDMPLMNGIELLQEIRRQQDLQSIPVTVLSSRDKESLPSILTDLQPAAVLCKPVTDETIAAIINALPDAPHSQLIH